MNVLIYGANGYTGRLIVDTAIKADIKITIGKGIQFKSVSSPSSVASMGAANFLKSGRCVNSHSLIFHSIHSAIGM